MGTSLTAVVFINLNAQTVTKSMSDRQEDLFSPDTKNIKQNIKIIVRNHYAKHLLEQGHSMQPIHRCMKVLELQQKSKKHNTLEQFHIYKVTKSGNQINEQFADNQNPIFESLLKIYQNIDGT
jgi:hypothetical protein